MRTRRIRPLAAALLGLACLPAALPGRALAADPWVQVSTPGFGDARNAELTRGTTFFSGAETFVYFGGRSTSTGAQVWRSSNGVTWSQANSSGFDVMGSSNQSTAWLAGFDGALLAGVASSSTPAGAGARIYRSTSGASPWALVFSSATTSSLDDIGVGGGFEVFLSTFYAGTENPAGGCAVWRSSSADWSGAWTRVASAGFGQGANNPVLSALKVFSGALYAATGSSASGRGQLWKTSDGSAWTQVLVASNTFSTGTKSIATLEAFGGYLYAGTLNAGGAQLWRSANPSLGSWTQVFSSDGDGSSRFSVAASSAIHALATVNNLLYAGTWDPGLNNGARIYRSSDGVTWIASNLPGFGAASQQWIGGFVATSTVLYAATRNDAAGGSVWRSSAALPGQPTLAASALGVSSIAWSWGSVLFADGFRVVSSTGGDLSGALAAGALTWTETGLSTNTAATRRVAAFNVLDASSSTALTRYTLAMAPAGTSLTGVFGSSLTVSWNDNTNPAGTNYRVDLWRAGSSTAATTVAASSAALTQLIGQTTYFLRVSAVNGDGVASDPDVTLSAFTQTVLVAVATVTAGSSGFLAINMTAGAATVSIPAGAFTADTVVTLQTAGAVPGTTASAAATLQATGVAIEMTESPSARPAKPVLLSIPYEDADVAGMDPTRLILARFDTTRNLWVPLASSPDPAGKRVAATTNHLSIFQIMQSVPASGLSDAKAFPNPLRPALGHTSMTFSLLPAATRLRIYTYSGERVRELTTDSSGIASWDGTNDSGGQAASGVYFVYTQGAGASRTFKVAIQR